MKEKRTAADVIEDYRSSGHSYSLAMLQDERRIIVTEVYAYAQLLGELKVNLNLVSTKRKLLYNSLVRSIKDNQKVSGAEAERLALNDPEFIEALKEESILDGRVERGKLMYSAMRDISSAMMQDISISKAERNYEESMLNGNFNG